MESTEVLVSVCCLTYNQEKYIKDALEGFVKQKTNFKYEVLIHDDASTDSTVNIIKGYQEKYPNIIKLIREEKNQYSQGKWSLLKTAKEAKGKYIALCEGDDFWIDENKLQTQIDYLESNPKCTFCFHNATVLDMSTNTTIEKFVPQSEPLRKYLKNDNIYNVAELELLGFIPTASFMFRAESLKKLPDWFEKCFVQDWPIKLLMTSFGYAYFIDKSMSVYRKNAEGSVTVANEKTAKESIDGEIYILNKKKEFINWIDEFTKNKYKEVFDLRKAEYEIELLLLQKNNKEIIHKQYLKKFDTKTRFKYLVKMYCPGIVKLYKKQVLKSSK